MSIFDKQVSEFLKTQEQNHICNLCGKSMKFEEEHGYFKCRKCKVKGGDVIKAPQFLIGTGNKPIKLFWATHEDCGKSNVCDLSQEPIIQVEKFKSIKVKQESIENEDGTWTLIPAHTKKVLEKIIWEKNKKQEKIMCTHCNVQFIKKVRGKK